MGLLVQLIKLGISVPVIFFGSSLFTAAGSEAAGAGVMIQLFGCLFFFMAEYMDVFALGLRKGSAASPKSNDERVWRYLGLFMMAGGTALLIASNLVNVIFSEIP